MRPIRTDLQKGRFVILSSGAGKRILDIMNDGSLTKLFELIATLRGENGCPWDREQTPDNILSDLIEETYELQWAHRDGSHDDVFEEMGDVVFVLVFAIYLLHEQDPSFTTERLTQHAYDKIKRRHPHVFGDAVARDKSEGLAHWERIKSEEKSGKGDDADLFADLPGNLPPIRHAEKIQKRAAGVGFDWSEPSGILDKIREELEEVERSITDGDQRRLQEEIGDLYFSVVNLSRFFKLDGAKALTDANAKFIRRYREMDRLIRADKRRLEDMTLAQMDEYWERAKRR